MRWVFLEGRHCAEVVGLEKATLEKLTRRKLDSEAWQTILRVTVTGSKENASPMLGSYKVESGLIRFRPKYPLEPGLTYFATYTSPRPLFFGEQATVGRPITIEAKPLGKPTTVVALEPSLDLLPENLLRFYLTFSAPMSRGQAYERVHLLDEKGKAISLPFLELGEELWSPDQTRLTLLFDPGRIKSGLKPREDDGPILEAGRAYTLVVDASWPDAQGQALAQGFRKGFRVGPAETVSPDPRRWTLTGPKGVGSRDQLVFRFEKPLDRALAARLISVIDRSGKPVAGKVEIEPDGRSGGFKPEAAWVVGDYRLQVEPALEDLAGNSVGKAFEVDRFQVDRPGRSDGKTPVQVPFRVGPVSTK